MSERLKGTVKFFNKKKFWGFIDSNGESYFVHGTSIAPLGAQLYEGDEVEFDTIQKPKGQNAVNVIILKMARDIKNEAK